jgi:thioredoxin
LRLESYLQGSFFIIFKQMSNVIDVIGKEQFDEIISTSDKLVLVDFWAIRCGPCKMLSPVLHDLADKYPDNVQIIKINVDEDDNADLAMEFQVRSIPQVTIFKDGKQVDQFIGVLPPEQVEMYVTKHMA